jgi:PPOX class probable F420-dependent enzyme
MATSSKNGRPLVVPFCYVYDGSSIYSSIDEKPKLGTPNRLRRILNILENPQVCLIADQYGENWGELRYVMIWGTARILHGGDEHGRAVALLREKYSQYLAMRLQDRPIIKVTPERVKAWSSTGS